MHVHLDPVGGCAGDMFIAALLDAWPELADGLLDAVRAVALPESVSLRVAEHRDHALTGTRFVVEDSAPQHDHVHFRTIRERLAAAAAVAPEARSSTLDDGVRQRALAIFTLLADAESRVHGTTIDDVTFHEVGAWDSIADVVGAAFLVDALGEVTWSCAPLPLGSGRVDSAHGTLPVPAPATVLLLEGLVVMDDGIAGERVTPTGAAIVRHLEPSHALGSRPRRLVRSGLGFGSRKLPGISNVLRVLAFDEPKLTCDDDGDIAVVDFEVDDQPAEDLAVGVERLRAMQGVLEVVQIPVLGKKGRLVVQVRILTGKEQLDRVIDACFVETTTIGLRWHLAHRTTLERRSETHVRRDWKIGVKCTERPHGVVTAKAEIDDVKAAAGGFAERTRLRRQAEAAVLAGFEPARRDVAQEQP